MNIEDVKKNMGTGKTTVDGIKENYKFILIIALIFIGLSFIAINYTNTVVSVITITILCIVSILLCLIKVGITVYNGDSKINTPNTNKVVSFIIKDNKSGKVTHIGKAEYTEALNKLKESKPIAHNMKAKDNKNKITHTVLIHVKGMGQYRYNIYKRFGIQFIEEQTSGVYKLSKSFRTYI